VIANPKLDADRCPFGQILLEEQVTGGGWGYDSCADRTICEDSAATIAPFAKRILPWERGYYTDSQGDVSNAKQKLTGDKAEGVTSLVTSFSLSSAQLFLRCGRGWSWGGESRF